MILITGARGFVGQRLMRDIPGAAAAPSLRDADEDVIRRLLDESGADTVIHTAAISSIPECEADPEASYRANVLLPVMLAKAAKGRKLVCFSSDQVYSGCEESGPYSEDTVKAANTYAAHKIEMEKRVLDIEPDAVLLRAEWMYDVASSRGNYVLNMMKAEGPVKAGRTNYRGVTYLREVAEVMAAVMKMPGGAYNFGSETTRSMFDITVDFLRLLGKDNEVQDAPGGHNLWMNCEKARSFGVTFSSVDGGLRRCAEDYRLIKG